MLHGLLLCGSVLVANNGNAAVKFIRSVRSWAYKTFGSEQAILIVAMATPDDMKVRYVPRSIPPFSVKDICQSYLYV